MHRHEVADSKKTAACGHHAARRTTDAPGALDSIRNAIVRHIQDVPDIGAVHAWQRHSPDTNALKALYTATIDSRRQLRGWHIKRCGAAETEPVFGQRAQTCTWLIRGYMEFSDADMSEIAFDNLIEAICHAFRADDTLGGLVITTFDEENGPGGIPLAGLQVREATLTTFAGVICHTALLELTTRHYIDVMP